MPEVRNCNRCRRIFMYTAGPRICEACKKLEEEDFEKVRKFLRDFPGASVPEVARETQVSTHLIYRFLKEGKLEVAESSPISLLCENCGERIKSGRFCIACSKRLAGEMIKTGQSLKEDYERSVNKNKKQEAGLRYLHGERKED